MTETDFVAKKNAELARWLIIVVIGMFGFGFALVPLYDVLCEVTGLNGKADNIVAKENSYQADTSRQLEVELMTTLNEDTALEFQPETKQILVNPGKYYTVNFFAKNKTDKVMEAQAIPSFSPGLVSKYIEKVECFCFKRQTFQPGESKKLPMRFVVKPDLPKDYKTITLSYTFFDNTDTIAQK